MHIAFIIPAFLPARDYGGPLYNTISLAQQYVKEGHGVTIYTTNAVTMKHFDRNIKITEEILGIRVKRFPVVLKIGGYWVNPSIYQALKADNFDIMHAQCLRCFQSDMAAAISKKTNKPLVIGAHGSLGSIFSSRVSLKQKVMHSLHNPIDVWDIRIARKLIAVNKFEKFVYQKYGVREDKIAEIPLGIDVSEFDDINGDFRGHFNIDNDEIMLLFVGRYNYVKGLDTLVKAFSEIIAKDNLSRKVRLVLIGKDDGYYGQLLDLISAHDTNDRIIALEGQPRDVILAAYKACDICIVPSHFDTFPVTILEALSCGKALIASRVGGIPEVIEHGKTGILVEPGDVKSLSENMIELIVDEIKRKNLGVAGRAAVRKYDMATVARQTMQLYSELINS